MPDNTCGVIFINNLGSLYIVPMKLISQVLNAISYMSTQYPNELEVENCTHINLTNSSVWKLHSEMFVEQEVIIANSSGVIHPGKSERTIFAVN